MPDAANHPKPSHSAYTALTLENHEGVRLLLRAILEGAGFEVLESADAGEAVRICKDHAGPIHLLIADVVLRGVSGPDAVRQILELRPDIRILFISAYPLEQLEDRGLISADRMGSGKCGFLQKPFTAASMLDAVDTLLPPTKQS